MAVWNGTCLAWHWLVRVALCMIPRAFLQKAVRLTSTISICVPLSSVIYLRHFHTKLPFSALFQQESIHFSVIYLRHIFSQVQHTIKKTQFCVLLHLYFSIYYCVMQQNGIYYLCKANEPYIMPCLILSWLFERACKSTLRASDNHQVPFVHFSSF